MRVERGLPLFKPIEGDAICILDDFNGTITKVKYIYGDSYDAYLKKALKLNRATIILPLIGSTTDLNDFPLMRSLCEEIFQQEKIDRNILNSEYLKDPKFKGSVRAMTIKPTALRILEFEEDDLHPGKKNP